MQYICLSICTLLEDRNENTVCTEILETAYRFTTVNFNYYDVASVMAKEPNTRGKKRNLYKTIMGKELDLYGLIVDSFAKNPPNMELDFNIIHNRIVEIIEEKGAVPDKQSVKTI